MLNNCSPTPTSAHIYCSRDVTVKKDTWSDTRTRLLSWAWWHTCNPNSKEAQIAGERFEARLGKMLVSLYFKIISK
jgi:hypothetical protein